MAILHIDGVATYNTLAGFQARYNGASGIQFNRVSPPFVGGGSFAMLGHAELALPTSAEIIFGQRIFIDTSSAAFDYCLIEAKIGTQYQCSLSYNPSNQKFSMCSRMGPSGGIWGAPGAILAQSAVCPMNMWHQVEVRLKIHPTAGVVELRTNGKLDSTYNGQTKYADSDGVDRLVWFVDSGWVIASYTDLYVMDTTGPAPLNGPIGNGRIIAQAPTGDTAAKAFVPDTGNANYARVNALPGGGPGSVTTTVAGARDLYSHAPLGLGAMQIFAIKPVVLGNQDDAGTLGLRTVISSGGTAVTGPSVGLSVSPTLVTSISSVDPATGLPWTANGWDAALSGFESVQL